MRSDKLNPSVGPDSSFFGSWFSSFGIESDEDDFDFQPTTINPRSRAAADQVVQELRKTLLKNVKRRVKSPRR
jgi:hypothetical protein